ncbi:MAG TPA: hypothetical protein VK402_19850 [Blastococcus sp.]|nr:hypothetical protein [Blastococcus sp.]
MNADSAPGRCVLPRLAAAATVSAALVAGGAAATTDRPSSLDDVVAIVNAWPKKYTGVGIVVEPSSEETTIG